MRTALGIVTLGVVTLAGACSSQPSGGEGPASTSSAAPTPQPSRNGATDPPKSDSVADRVVRFTKGRHTVDVVITNDTVTTRALVDSLPVTLEVTEFAGHEKIAYLPAKLPVGGVPGSRPENGDLIYYAPWGNLGFYYDAEGSRYDANVIHVGTFEAHKSELAALEGGQVRVELVR